MRLVGERCQVEWHVRWDRQCSPKVLLGLFIGRLTVVVRQVAILGGGGW